MRAKIIKISQNWHPKSIKNQGCAADAFLKRFGVGLGRQTITANTVSRTILGAIFDEKSKKWHPKRNAKIDAEKVLKNDEKKKTSKMMPKWMPKSMIFNTFSKKAQSHETI